MPNPINIFLCFSRSGGTVLNQCLGCLPNVVIMSEVNPLGGGWGKEGENSPTTIQAQAKEWYGIELQHSSFAESAIELSEKCGHLIIRDWSFANFVPNPTNQFNPPGRFLTVDALSNVPTHIFAFVRNAAEVYLSIEGVLEPFAYYYRKYAEYLASMQFKIFKYEDFCENPELVLKQICDHCEIPYFPVTDSYSKFITVNGDTQNDKSRGILQNKIARLPRKAAPNHIEEAIKALNDLNIADELLGY